MPSVEYYQAIKLLNDKCDKDWKIAVTMLTDEELYFVRRAMGGNYNLGNEFTSIHFMKYRDGFKFEGKFWKYAYRFNDIIVSEQADIIQVIRVVEENSKSLIVIAKHKNLLFDKNSCLQFCHNQSHYKLHTTVYEAFKGPAEGRIGFKNSDLMDCKLANLIKYKERPKPKKPTHTGPMPVEQHKLYKHKDEILQMRNEQELPFSVIGRRYHVSGPTIKNFLVKLQQVGD